MPRKKLTLVLATLALLTWTGAAAARGGHYVFDGGTAAEQTQVRAALEISQFDWSLVPATITIHLRKGLADSYATPGQIWLDRSLIDAGTFAWATIQHEYAHQVDYYLLTDSTRVQLNAALGGAVWAPGAETGSTWTPTHAQLGEERFASTLAWSYWQSPLNALKPTSKKDESAAMPPAQFRPLLAQLLGITTAN